MIPDLIALGVPDMVAAAGYPSTPRIPAPSKASPSREAAAFADHWRQVTGHDPDLLIFDSKLTTQAVLAELDDRKIGFITLRARHPAITNVADGRSSR